MVLFFKLRRIGFLLHCEWKIQEGDFIVYRKKEKSIGIGANKSMTQSPSQYLLILVHPLILCLTQSKVQMTLAVLHGTSFYVKYFCSNQLHQHVDLT